MTRIQQRHDTLNNWQQANPVLLEGEIAFETDTNSFKIGNGIDNYLNLPYQRNSVTNKLNIDGSNATVDFTVNGVKITDNLITPTNGNIIIGQDVYNALTFTQKKAKLIADKGVTISNDIDTSYSYLILEDNVILNSDTHLILSTNDIGKIVIDGDDLDIIGYNINLKSRSGGGAYYNDTEIAKADLSNISSETSSKAIDGQWISSSLQLATTITTGVCAYDLTTYLPRDTYNYEVIVTAWGATGKVSGNYTALYATSAIITGQQSIARAITKTNDYAFFGGTAVVPIGSDRVLTINNTGNADSDTNSSSVIAVRGYRRIGTNK